MPRYKQDELFATISGGADDRVFLGWDRPVVAAAVEHLCRDWDGGLLDLSSKMVVVPTRHAGRRLREALAGFTAERDSAVVPPLTVPPEYLVTPARLSANVSPPASSSETVLAWISVLQAANLETCRHLFPVEPVERGFSWALQTANQFERLRSALGESGHTIHSAVSTFGKILDEPARWKELAALERKMAAILNRAKRTDPLVARKMAADGLELPGGIETVVVLVTPDPNDLAITALDKLSSQARTEVVIFAPEELAELFDGWGRPLAIEWGKREIPILDAAESIHISSNPRAQASKLVGLLGESFDPGVVSVGVPDAEVTPHLETALRDRGYSAFNPDGLPFSRHELGHTLAMLGDLLRARSFRAFNALATHPDFLRSVGASASQCEDTVTSVLAQIDKLRDDHLPDTIDDLVEAKRRSSVEAGAARLIDSAAGWLEKFDRAGQSGFGNTLLEFLGFLYGRREFRNDRPDDAAFSAIAGEISATLETLEGPVAKAARCRLGPADLLDLVLQSLGKLTFYREREADDFDLQGWLELLWDDSPHLILTGCNDGKVPDTIVGDPFLPNQARALIGLKDNERRFGRDAYLLTCLLASRKAAGRLDFIVGKTSNNGDPLRPSRLLFQCTDEELPDRALHLFQEESPESGEPAPAWTRAWQLKPPQLPVDARIRSKLSVTAFSSFLSCPFRFYLSHGLDMREVDDEKQEMTPMEFGNLCHYALERLGRNETMRDCDDENEVREYLLSAADDYVERRYGRLLTVPVRIQLEAARQRLAWAAGVHVEDRREGWRIEEVEWRFDQESAWEIGGLQITGTIDRIDRHTHTNARRVIDYKTSNKATTPDEAHLIFLKRTESSSDFREWLLFPGPEGRIMRWINLQLPLYVLALNRMSEEDTPITAGYFNLPRSVGETAITTWNGLNEELLAQALACAEAAVSEIRAEKFWPPAERPRFDDFRRLFFGNAEESVNEEFVRS